MKKALIAVLLLAALLLSACGAKAAPDAESAAPAPETAPPAQAPTAEPAAPVQEAEPAAEARETAALEDVLEQIRTGVQPGTAGSSLKAAAVAAALLDWAQTAPDRAAAEAAALAWRDALDEDARDLLPVQLDSLRYAVETLCGDEEASAGLRADAGLEDRGPWSEDAAGTALWLLGLLA